MEILVLLDLVDDHLHLLSSRDLRTAILRPIVVVLTTMIALIVASLTVLGPIRIWVPVVLVRCLVSLTSSSASSHICLNYNYKDNRIVI